MTIHRRCSLHFRRSSNTTLVTERAPITAEIDDVGATRRSGASR